MPLTIDILALGPLMTNCYVLRSKGQCWIIDPGPGTSPLLAFLRNNNEVPSRILLTHGHGDHIGGISSLKKVFPEIAVACPAGDAPMIIDAELNLSADFGMPIQVAPADEIIQPGQTLALGDVELKVLDTSGHTEGGVSYYCTQAQAVFTGDALFSGSIGRCDLPGADMARLLANIQQNLLSLPEQTRVFPGHGDPTTIGQEENCNPYL